MRACRTAFNSLSHLLHHTHARNYAIFIPRFHVISMALRRDELYVSRRVSKQGVESLDGCPTLVRLRMPAAR